MKKPKEIREMAEKFAYAVDGTKDGDQSSAYGYEMGYTKCQEDNADKKYTIEDMRDFAKKCCCLWNDEDEISYPELVDNEILKKQD